jgi:hypothetical protein
MSHDIDERSSVLSLADRMGRRGFMRKLSVAAVGLATALAGLPQTARAAAAPFAAGCCSLCSNSTNCSGRCCWSWGCCGARGTLARICKECYSAASCGGDGCGNGWRCSQMITTGVRCA